MDFLRATEDDFDAIRAFYVYVIENTETMRECCRWVYGLHPHDELLLRYIRDGDLYYLAKDGRIAAAVAVTKSQTEEYHGVPWQKELADDEVTAGHLLCVDPALKRQGVAKTLLRHVCELTASMGKKAYRFDTLASNTPAQALYDSLGFRRIAVKHWYAVNTGWTDFILYEKLI